MKHKIMWVGGSISWDDEDPDFDRDKLNETIKKYYPIYGPIEELTIKDGLKLKEPTVEFDRYYFGDQIVDIVRTPEETA